MVKQKPADGQKPKAKNQRKKKAVTLSLQDLMTQPSQLAHLPMMNKVTGYRVLLTVLQRLQGLWKIAKMQKQMPQADSNGQLYLNFITDEFEVKRQTEGVYNEGDVVFKFRLSEIADDPHYEEARIALLSITHIQCFVPDKNDPGYYITENLMKVRGKRVNGKYVGTDFEAIVPRNIAENMLDINLFGNYTRFLGYTAGKLRSTFSYPLYIYLSEEWRSHGDHFITPMNKLRYRLGFVKGKDDPDRENRYSSWSQFCDKVLNQAQKELDKLAESGGADFTFTYQGLLYGTPLPPYKRPDAVAFTILPTEAGLSIKEENDYAPNRELAQSLMVDYFKLTVRQTRALLRRVTPSVMSGFIAHLQQRHDEFEAHRHPEVKSIAAWMHDDIDRYIRAEENKFFTQSEEIKDTPASPSSASDGSPVGTVASPSSPLSSPSGKRRGRPRKHPASDDPLLIILRSLDIERDEPEKLMAQMQDHPAALMAEAKRLQQYYAECRAGLHPEQPAIHNQGGHALTRLQNFINTFKAKLQAASPASDGSPVASPSSSPSSPSLDYAAASWSSDPAVPGNMLQFTTKGDARAKLWSGLRHYMADAQWLPAYEDIAAWYADNGGRGLLCTGFCGLGKTRICKDILPKLFQQDFGDRLQLLAVNATDMVPRIDELLAFCKHNSIIVIDDLGTEPTEAWVNYRKRNVFFELVNAAEQNGTLLIITTNLPALAVNAQQPSIESRYGLPTTDRLRANTRCVVFQGDSLRK